MKLFSLNSLPSKTPVCKMWVWSERSILLQKPQYFVNGGANVVYINGSIDHTCGLRNRSICSWFDGPQSRSVETVPIIIKYYGDSETGFIYPLITDIGLLNVINNCPKINSIQFYGRSNISHKTIDGLIALALRKHNIYFKHHFSDIGKSCSYDSAKGIVFNVIDLKSYQLPNNLVIN